jgi:hypothetical protein
MRVKFYSFQFLFTSSGKNNGMLILEKCCVSCIQITKDVILVTKLSAQNNITARKRVLVIGDFGKNVNMLNGKLG